jgi:hypothetical protein
MMRLERFPVLPHREQKDVINVLLLIEEVREVQLIV